MKTLIENLLNLKRWGEESAKGRFATLIKELAAEKDQLYSLESQYDFTGKMLKSNVNELMDIDKIKRVDEFIGHLLIKIHRQKILTMEREKQVEDARMSLAQASKERKTFERLDEKQKIEKEKEFAKKEQLITDEHAVTQHYRKTL